MVATLPAARAATGRDLLWEHCRNNLGIARLLVHEGRPDYLVATACRMAVETAVRAALEQSRQSFDGDLRRSLEGLSAPPDLAVGDEQDLIRPERLAATERAVGWIAAWLRRRAPERTWGY